MKIRPLVLSLFMLVHFAGAADAKVVFHDLPLSDPSARAKVDLGLGTETESVEPSFAGEEVEVVKSIVEIVESDPRGALKKLEVAVTPQSSAMLDFVIGNLYFQFDEREAALRYYQSAVKKFPRFAKAHKNLGYLAPQSEKFDEALEAFRKTVELGGIEGGIYGLLGYIYLNKENFLSAESAYRDATLKMPDTIDWKLGIGRAVLAHQKHADVMNVMGELIAVDPKKRDYWLLQANAFLSMGRVMDAAYNYEIMGRMGMGDKETYQALGNIYVSQDKAPLALIAYLAAVNLPDPSDMTTALSAAEIMGARGSLAESSTLATRIDEVYGDKASKEDTVRLLKLRSSLAIIQDRREEAEPFLERLIKIDDSDGETILLLADFYARSDRYELAKPLYDRAEKIEGFEIDSLVKHGQILVANGDYEDAIVLLERAVEELGQTDDETRRDNVSRYLESVRRVFRNTRS
jgi:tetratricopeptide (TPR) repeat protein